MDHTDRSDRSPAVAELLEDAYSTPVSVETAARHLWSIHKAADRLAAEVAAEVGGELVGAGSQPASSSMQGRRIPRAAVPMLVAVMLMSSSGMALAASQSSLPGDVLYPVKRGTETAQLIFTRNPETRAQLQLAFARARLDEIRRIGVSRPQHIPSLVSDIALSLSEVEQTSPEIAPASQRLREETTEEIASLHLSTDVTVAVDQALAAAPTSTVTTTPPAPTSETATVPSAVADSSTTEPGGTGSIDTDDLDTDDLLTPTPTATATPSASPTPSGSPTATPTSSPTASASASASDEQVADQDSSSAQPSTAAQPTGSASDADEDGDPAPAGTVVTPRPQPSGEGGESRADDGSDAPAQPETDADASDDGETSEPVQPYTRPE